MQGTAIHSNSLQLTATHAATQTADDHAWTATHCNTLQLCNSLRPTATARDNAWTSAYCNTLWLAAIDCLTRYNIRRQYTATRCNSLQHTLHYTLQHTEGRQRLVTTPRLPKTCNTLQLAATHCNTHCNIRCNTGRDVNGSWQRLDFPRPTRRYLWYPYSYTSACRIYIKWMCDCTDLNVAISIFRLKCSYIYFHMLSRCMQICMCIRVYV